VETDPGASVYVDGKHYGEAASDGKLMVSIQLGKHEVKLEKYGFAQQKGDFEFKFQSPVSIKQRLVLLPNSADFKDDFDHPEVSKSKWVTPASGWKFENGRLRFENCPELMYPSDSNYRDFKMGFHLKLENGRGAAWALRVKDSANYYLFYLTGPDEPFANRFLTYIVRDGKFDPARPYLDDSLPSHLEPSGQYTVDITATGNVIEHEIYSSKTGKRFPIGAFKDNNNFFIYGTIGFRTIGGEKFSIDEVVVTPPAVKPGGAGSAAAIEESDVGLEDLWRHP
jgi:hypothetical protein